jgi:hypothetical protein
MNGRFPFPEDYLNGWDFRRHGRVDPGYYRTATLEELQYQADWEEVVDNSSTSTATVSAIDSSASMLIRVPWRKRVSALCLTVGVSRVNGTKIERWLPVRHPYYPWLWCSSVAVRKDEIFDGMYDSENPNPRYLPEGDLNDNFTARAYLERIEPPAEGSLPAYAVYGSTVLELQFRALPYRVESDEKNRILVEDGGFVPEWERFTSVENESIDPKVLHASPGSYKFAEGAPNGKLFPGEINLIEGYSNIQMTWHQVPEEYLCSNFYEAMTYPNKLAEAVGTVNSTEFMGCPAGTLLYMGYSRKRYVSPLQNMVNLRPENYFYNDVTLNFSRFDPLPGEANPLRRGHLLKPYRQNFKYYTVKNASGDNGTRKYTYREYEFRTLFQHHSFVGGGFLVP